MIINSIFYHFTEKNSFILDNIFFGFLEFLNFYSYINLKYDVNNNI